MTAPPMSSAMLNVAAARSVDDQLFSAYQGLHNVARTCKLPFDAPAILVVGHQTDGKSALVEALMGFQFNDVGGGTKTRRPICLHMEYQATATTPLCFLVNDIGVAESLTLEALKAHISKDNEELGKLHQFAEKEMIVRIQYHKCPNLTIIDMPGLIMSTNANAHASTATPDRASDAEHLARSRAQVLAMAKAKMSDPTKYTILALENVDDWDHHTTRELISEVDPTGAHTVMVSTKIDARMLTFSAHDDVNKFLNPGHILKSGDREALLGGPFFTCVPTGRVGDPMELVITSDEAYRHEIENTTAKVATYLQSKLGRPLLDSELSRIGGGKLLSFLQQLLLRQYRAKLPMIVMQLSDTLAQAEEALKKIDLDILDLDPVNLKATGNMLTELFLDKLKEVQAGTAKVDSKQFGMTSAQEHAAGSFFFLGKDGTHVLAAPNNMCNPGSLLYGGAQVMRAMTEWNLTMSSVGCPAPSEDDILNASGGYNGDQDGPDVISGAAKIASPMAYAIFRPCIYQMGKKMTHIVKNMLPVVKQLLLRDYNNKQRGDHDLTPSHDAFYDKLGARFFKYIEEQQRLCEDQSVEGLEGITNYVVWNMHFEYDKAMALGPVAEGLQVAQGGVGALLGELLLNRQLTPNNKATVERLVLVVFDNMRDEIIRFNQFFILRILKTFPAALRAEMALAFEENIEQFFDLEAMKTQLLSDKSEMLQKLETLRGMRAEFDSIQRVVKSTTSS